MAAQLGAQDSEHLKPQVRSHIPYRLIFVGSFVVALDVPDGLGGLA